MSSNLVYESNSCPSHFINLLVDQNESIIEKKKTQKFHFLILMLLFYNDI